MVQWIDTSSLFSPVCAFPFRLLSDLPFKLSTKSGSIVNFSILCQVCVGSVVLPVMVPTYFLKLG